MTLIIFLIYLAVIVVSVEVGGRLMMGRVFAAMAHARWEPVPPTEAHWVLGPVVADLQVEGYVVDSHALLSLGGRPVPAVALFHPDGSMATVRQDRSPIGASATRLGVESILLPGERSLGTVAYASVLLRPDSLAEVAARRPDVPVVVARHREARGWIASQGVAVVPVLLGGAGPVIEAGMRAVAARPFGVSLWVVRWRQLVGGGRYRTPVSERTDLIPVANAVRQRQQELGIRPPA